MEQISKINNINISDKIQDFFNYIDVSKESERVYKSSIKTFIEFIGVDTKPTRQDVLKYKEYLIKTLKPTTANSKLIAIKQLFKWLSYEGIYPNITENIKQVPIGEIDKNYPNLEEIKYILGTIEDKYSKALFMLLALTGIRISEAQNANIEDIQELHGQTVLYVKGKGRVGKEEYVKVSDTLLNALQSVINGRKERSYILKQARRKNDYKGITQANKKSIRKSGNER